MLNYRTILSTEASTCSPRIYSCFKTYTCSYLFIYLYISILYLLTMFASHLAYLFIVTVIFSYKYLIFCCRDIHLFICLYLTCHVMYDLREVKCMFCSVLFCFENYLFLKIFLVRICINRKSSKFVSVKFIIRKNYCGGEIFNFDFWFKFKHFSLLKMLSVLVTFVRYPLLNIVLFLLLIIQYF